jgi:hypothetical protein
MRTKGTSVNVVIHEGPVMMHLSRVPAGQDVRAYDGSGEWVKIYTMGIEIRKELDYPVYWLPRGNQKNAPRVSFPPILLLSSVCTGRYRG